MSDDQEQDNTSKRGFASMPREKVQELARKGGQARAEKARQSKEDREQGGTGGESLDDELKGTEEQQELGEKLDQMDDDEVDNIGAS